MRLVVSIVHGSMDVHTNLYRVLQGSEPAVVSLNLALDVLIAHGVNSLNYNAFKDLTSATGDAFALSSMASNLAKKRKNKKRNSKLSLGLQL